MDVIHIHLGVDQCLAAFEVVYHDKAGAAAMGNAPRIGSTPDQRLPRPAIASCSLLTLFNKVILVPTISRRESLRVLPRHRDHYEKQRETGKKNKCFHSGRLFPSAA
jgi:hypothetical protein